MTLPVRTLQITRGRATMDANRLMDTAREVGNELARGLGALVSEYPLVADNEAADSTADAAVSQVMERAMGQLAATNCWGRGNSLPSREFWQAAGPIFREGSLQVHAREKPGGYAGDYLLLDRICRHDLQGTGIGRRLDAYFQRHAAPEAVRNRATLIADDLAKCIAASPADPYRIYSIGSGPGHDLSLLAERLPKADRRRIRITLLDLDPRALDFAEERLTRLWTDSGQVRTLHVNLGRLHRWRERGIHEGQADFVFCAGFLDYLERDAAIAMLQVLRSFLAPAGQLLVFNFGLNNPSRAYMEWIGNWYLVYRNADDLRELAAAAGWQTIEVGCEPAGVNLYLRARNGSA